MKKKNEYSYFDTFVHLVDYSVQAAELLNKALTDFEPSQMESLMKKMHEIEHTGDNGKHELMNRLVREFITPIEREDIMGIVQEIDQVTDQIEDVLMRMYMFNVQEMRPEAMEFTKVIVSCCEALKKAMEDFHNFRKSTEVKKNIIEINRLEEVGDAFYTKAVRNLYVTSKDSIEIMVWTELFEQFEKCCDACEDVANLMESVIMKNT